GECSAAVCGLTVAAPAGGALSGAEGVSATAAPANARGIKRLAVRGGRAAAGPRVMGRSPLGGSDDAPVARARRRASADGSDARGPDVSSGVCSTLANPFTYDAVDVASAGALASGSVDDPADFGEALTARSGDARRDSCRWCPTVCGRVD